MGTLNQNLSLLDSMLGNPKAQKPTMDQRLTQVMLEFQHLVNELGNTNKPWLSQTVTVSVNAGTEDYLVPGNVGKVLFVYANRSDQLGPIGLTFADLAHVSSDFYLFSPLDYGFARDFNEALAVPSPAEISFYRQGGALYFRLPPFNQAVESVSIVSSVGNWLDGLTSNDSFVLQGHEGLALARAGMNLLPMTEWAGDDAYNDKQQAKYARSLAAQADRYQSAWIIAKRSMHDDQPTCRDGGVW